MGRKKKVIEKNKSRSTRNLELMDYIKRYYLNGSVTQQEIADSFDMSLGGVKNFMYRHNINKKQTYSTRNKEIKSLYENGVSVSAICKVYDMANQNVYTILNNES